MNSRLKVACVLSILTSGLAAAQNDECSGALAALDGVPFAFDTSFATTSMTPWPCALGGSDLWYSYVPSSTGGAVTVDVCGSSYDTAVEGFTGSCGALVSAGCNDDFCGLQSTLTFGPTVAGTPLFFRIGGFNAGSGPGTCTVTEAGPGVGNDECAGALPLTAGVAEAFDTSGASTSVPAWPCALGGNDLWFQYTTTQSAGEVRFETCGSGFDTAIEIFSGTCASLTSIVCNDDSCGLQSAAQIPYTGAGTVFYVRVGGFNGGTGPGALLATELLPPPISRFSGVPPSATCLLDFDTPFVASGAIGASDPAFTSFGIASVNLVGTWATGGDAMTVGSNVNGQGLVSDMNGALTIAGPGEPLDTPTMGAGFDIQLSASTSEFGLKFVDQIGFTYTVELLSGGASLGVESFIYGPGNTFPEPGNYWTSTAGSFDRIIILFLNSGGVGVDEIAFAGCGSGNIGTPICAGEPNSTGFGAELGLVGSAVLADMDLTVTIDGLPFNSVGYVVTSMEQNFVMNPGGSLGNLCIASFVMGRFANNVLDSGMTGSASFSPDLTAFPTPTGSEPVMVGDTRYFQHWYRDTSGGAPVTNFSSASCLTFL